MDEGFLESAAHYLNGLEAKTMPVTVRITQDAQLSLWLNGVLLESYALASCDIVPPLGKSLRVINLPDGGRLELSDLNFVDAIESNFKLNQAGRWINRIESYWRYIVAGSIVVMLGVLLFIWQAIPFMAKKAAFALPVSVNSRIGAQSLNLLDGRFFKASELPAARQAELQSLFRELSLEMDSNFNYSLLLRRGGIVGANAFALPDGHIVFTDELIDLAESNDEIMGVMLHEFAHVSQRHGLRSLLQNTGLLVIVNTILGDLSAISIIAVNFPVLLMENGYSRAFEKEADSYAAQYYIAHQLSPTPYRRMLEHLQTQADAFNVPSILSTHPNTAQRIEALKALE